MIDSSFARRVEYDVLSRDTSSRRRTSKNTSASRRVPLSEAVDLNDTCESLRIIQCQVQKLSAA